MAQIPLPKGRWYRDSTIWIRNQRAMFGLAILGFLLFGRAVLYLLFPYMNMPLLGLSHQVLQVVFCIVGGIFGVLPIPGILIYAIYVFRDGSSPRFRNTFPEWTSDSTSPPKMCSAASIESSSARPRWAAKSSPVSRMSYNSPNGRSIPHILLMGLTSGGLVFGIPVLAKEKKRNYAATLLPGVLRHRVGQPTLLRPTSLLWWFEAGFRL